METPKDEELFEKSWDPTKPLEFESDLVKDFWKRFEEYQKNLKDQEEEQVSSKEESKKKYILHW